MISEQGRRQLQGDVWERLVRERVGESLRPERLRTLLLVVPAASGDVALSTTVIRYVKRNNPQCRVTFATRKANISLARMCPGVDQTIELPHESAVTDRHGWKTLSRRKYLQEFSGQADAVLCTCFYPEDADLLTDHGLNALEAIWLLAGVSDGVPAMRQQVWLETPLAPAEAITTIRRSLSRQARTALVKRAVLRLPESLALIASTRSLKGTGIRVVGKDLRGLTNIREVSDPVHEKRLAAPSFAHEFVILSTEATSLPPPPEEVVHTLVGMLRQDGRTVLHNVRDPLQAAPGTVPLVCSYEEFLCLRASGIPFVGWRSGLCDVAAASRTPMSIFCPRAHDWLRDIRHMFGLGAMNVDADCLEVVGLSASDVAHSGLLEYLNRSNLSRNFQ